MYNDIPTILAVAFLVFGTWLLMKSALLFVNGSEVLARVRGVPPFIIGMVIIGFGTSSPELVVSTLSSVTGHSDLSLGNAFGSNIFNIAVILGVAALIRPITVRPSAVFYAVPILLAVSLFTFLLVHLGGGLSRLDGILMLVVFAILLPVYSRIEKKASATEEGNEAAYEETPPMRHPVLAIVVGLALLVLSSHLLLWGAVDVARALGVSELMIGLTVIAAGTSLPELASAIVAARKGQHEFVLGNIIGSNFFNTLAVVGVSGTISPFNHFSPNIVTRDLPVMLLLSLSIAFFGANYGKIKSNGRITRIEGCIWILAFLVYTLFLIHQETNAA